MATVTRGYTFGATEQITNTKLHTLVDSGTVTNVAQADIVAANGLILRGTTAPTDTDQLWSDTNTTPPTLKIYDGASWVPTDELNILTNKAAVTLSPGAVVIIDTSNSESIKTTSTQGSVSWRGIALQSTAANATGVFKAQGYVPNIALETSASAGCFLCTSTATGKAVQVASGTAGIFAVVTTAGTASAAGYLLGNAFQGGYTPTAANALSGSVVQTVETQSGAVATGTTVIPQDDTIPQITEGDQYLSQAITPGNASNLLLITAVVNLSNNNGSPYLVVALFQDATANALCASQESPGAQAQVSTCITLRHYMTAGTTSATTFRIRCGCDLAGTTTVNGTNAGRKLGGVLISSLSIQEIKA